MTRARTASSGIGSLAAIQPLLAAVQIASRTSSIQIVHAGYAGGLELYRNTAALSHTEDTNLTTLATITVRANSMGRIGEIIIDGSAVVDRERKQQDVPGQLRLNQRHGSVRRNRHP